MAKTRQEIDDLKQRLDAEGVDYVRKRGNNEEEKPENPAYISLAAQLSGVRSEIDTINRMIANFETTATDYKKRIAATPAVEENYNALLGRQANTRLKYNDLLQKTMEAEVAQGLEKDQKGERFTLIDPARLPEKPFKPNRWAIVLIGLVLGIGTGVGFAALKEITDTAAYTPETLTRQTGGPVLAAIPVIVTAADAARRKRRGRIKIVAFIVLLIAVPDCLSFPGHGSGHLLGQAVRGGWVFSAHPEMASFGPWRRSRFLSVLGVAGLRLWAPVGSGLARNRNLPFLDGHYFLSILTRHLRWM